MQIFEFNNLFLLKKWKCKKEKLIRGKMRIENPTIRVISDKESKMMIE